MPDVGFKFDARIAEAAKMIFDINYKKEWDILFKNQIISGNNS